MILLDVIKKALDSILSSEEEMLVSKIDKQKNDKKYENINKRLFSLNSNVRDLKKEIKNINRQINDLTIINEELLHMLEMNTEKSLEKNDDKNRYPVVKYTPKKHELN